MYKRDVYLLFIHRTDFLHNWDVSIKCATGLKKISDVHSDISKIKIPTRTGVCILRRSIRRRYSSSSFGRRKVAEFEADF